MERRLSPTSSSGGPSVSHNVGLACVCVCGGGGGGMFEWVSVEVCIVFVRPVVSGLVVQYECSSVIILESVTQVIECDTIWVVLLTFCFPFHSFESVHSEAGQSL